MSPFDICFIPADVRVLTHAERAEKRLLERKARKLELAALARGSTPVQGRKRGANPPAKRKYDVVPPPQGVVAAPRERDWRVGQYKPDAGMRDALDRARAEQPSLMSLSSKEKP